MWPPERVGPHKLRLGWLQELGEADVAGGGPEL
jgi:hypothetical protein